MPPRTPKACRVRGCRSTTTDSTGYCFSHKAEGWRQYKPGQTRQQRGYGTKWEIIRARILKRDNGLCQSHIKQGIVKQASCCSAAKFFAPKRIKLCTAATERKTDIAHGAN